MLDKYEVVDSNYKQNMRYEKHLKVRSLDQIRKENIKKFKKTAKKVAWTILMISAGACWTITYYQWQDFRADYLTSVDNSTRIIESHGDVVKPNQEAATQVTPTSTEEITEIDTPLESRSVEQIIEDTAKQHGFKDVELLKRIAKCESSLNPQAKNTESTATGIYQYLAGTWEEACKKTGHTDWTLEDRTDVEKATRVAIWHISRGELSRWNESKVCWNS